MQLDQLQQGLQHAFFTDRHRIVFWYDAPGHFADSLNELALEGVQAEFLALALFGARGRFGLCRSARGDDFAVPR